MKKIVFIFIACIVFTGCGSKNPKEIATELYVNNFKTQELEESGRFYALPKIYEDDIIRGNPKAKNTIITYLDFKSIYSAKNAKTFSKIIDYYSNDIRIVYKHFPKNCGKNCEIDVAFRCAYDQNDDFGWNLYEKFLEIPEDIKTNAMLYSENTEIVDHWIKEIGIDIDVFKKCKKSKKFLNKINDDFIEAKLSDLYDTSYFVNDYLLHGSYMDNPFDVIKDIIENNNKYKKSPPTDRDTMILKELTEEKYKKCNSFSLGSIDRELCIPYVIRNFDINNYESKQLIVLLKTEKFAIEQKCSLEKDEDSSDYIECLKNKWKKIEPNNPCGIFDSLDKTLENKLNIEKEICINNKKSFTHLVKENLESRINRCLRDYNNNFNFCFKEIFNSEFFSNKEEKEKKTLIKEYCSDPVGMTNLFCVTRILKNAYPEKSNEQLCEFFIESVFYKPELLKNDCLIIYKAQENDDPEECYNMSWEEDRLRATQDYDQCVQSIILKRAVDNVDMYHCDFLKEYKEYTDRVAPLRGNVTESCYLDYRNEMKTKIKTEKVEGCYVDENFFKTGEKSIINATGIKLCDCIGNNNLICHSLEELTKDNAKYNNKEIFSFDKNTEFNFDECPEIEKYFSQPWFDDFQLNLAKIGSNRDDMLQHKHITSACYDSKNHFLLGISEEYRKIIKYNSKTGDIAYINMNNMDISNIGKRNGNIINLYGDISNINDSLVKIKYQYNLLTDEIVKVRN